VQAAGVQSVGVFVDESASTIVERASAAKLSCVQLHGDGARESLPELPESFKVIYVLQATPDGVIQSKLPSEQQNGTNSRKVPCHTKQRGPCTLVAWMASMDEACNSASNAHAVEPIVVFHLCAAILLCASAPASFHGV
jgi:hypothetical protein